MQIQIHNFAFKAIKSSLNVKGVSLFQYVQHSIKIFQKVAHHSAQYTENYFIIAPLPTNSLCIQKYFNCPVSSKR